MIIITSLLRDLPDRYLWEDFTYEDDGATLVSIATRVEWKAGSDGDNEAKLMAKAEQAQAYFADAYQNWATYTNAQKDDRVRQAMRALANLARMVCDEWGSSGI
jgi:hypothetical protein